MNYKQLNQLNKAYKKKLKMLNKTFFSNKDIGLIIFIEYLKYLRDVTVVKNVSKDCLEANQDKLATLITAVAEFEAFYEHQDATQSAFHWANFCELMKQNMEEWLTLYDSI